MPHQNAAHFVFSIRAVIIAFDIEQHLERDRPPPDPTCLNLLTIHKYMLMCFQYNLEFLFFVELKVECALPHVTEGFQTTSSKILRGLR